MKSLRMNSVTKEVKLKSGKVVLIRQAESKDAEKLLRCVKHYIPKSEFIPKLEEEMTRNPKETEEWIRSFLGTNNSLLLVAEFEDEIVGNIDLTGSKRQIMRHTAVIGMGMLPEFQNSGLGTSLLSTAIDWSKKNAVLELLWLQVYTENVLGLNLYKKMGFEENGIIKNFFKSQDSYSDQLTMSLSVKGSMDF